MQKLLILFIVCLATGCSPVAKLLTGYKAPKPYNTEQVSNWAKKTKIEQFALYSLDTTYFEYTYAVYNNAWSRKNLNQPMMVMYFKNDTLIGLNNNCAFPGIPYTKWNAFGDFNLWPPKTSYPDTVFNLITLSGIRPYLTPVKTIKFDNGEYLLVIICNNFQRQSKRLAKLIKEKYSDRSLRLIFVNDDRYLYYKGLEGF
jgi:hypothetical protein